MIKNIIELKGDLAYSPIRLGRVLARPGWGSLYLVSLGFVVIVLDSWGLILIH
jgi:hypothetical protein